MLRPALSAIRAPLLLLAVAPCALPACDSLYYKTMKRFGVEKRDILVKRVREARGAQDAARDQFASALDRFKSVIAVEQTPLEEKYERLDKELRRCEDRAKEVHDRIDAVRHVSDDLFKEWRQELKQYNDRALRQQSERELDDTRRRTEAVTAAMQRAERRIDPVLAPLRDRVLFLKHNLNAKALGGLDQELVSIRGNVDALVADMTRAMTEADGFIRQMEQEKP